MRRSDERLQRLGNVAMFQACSQKELQAIARAGEEVTIADGKAIITEGDRGQEFFVILDGKAVVTRGGRKIATLGPGDYFGELALLEGGPRDATITAQGDVQVLAIYKPQFTSLLATIPSLNRKLLVGMARRLHETAKAPIR
jgi:CRP/FNR family cyclic AMP-dependent transcriptional regulator